MSKKKSEPNNKLEIMRHSCEHILHQAMIELFPGLKRAMGPATDEGFYHDFDPSPPAGGSGQVYKISEADFPKIEKRMREIIKKDLPFIKKEISIVKARKLFKDNQYKQEWLDEIALRQTQGKKEKVTVYWTGEPDQTGSDVDLCSGPHVKSTGKIGPFKLLKIAGAYWRGDEKNKMLTRIYGTCFSTKKELDDYLWQIEETKKRDHRKIGKELDLFLFDDEVGQGLPLFLPNGAILRNEIINFAFNTYLKRGYLPVSTPHIANINLWKHSGHWDFYKEGMYAPFGIDEEQYTLKPMNCPAHVKIYDSKIRSYRDLPIRYTEMGTVYRYEKSGVLHGLTRVRGFTQDDAHIICRPDQLLDELIEMIDLTEFILNSFGFKNLRFHLSVRDPLTPEKYMGKDKDWKFAEKMLEQALKAKGYKDFPRDEGEAVFYGPKIDLKIADVLGREWQLSTIQIDFNLPQRFKMSYIDKDSKKKQPFILHRALLGSIERFTGILIEHYAGAFPVWLAPVQVKIIPIANRHQEYGEKILKKLLAEDVRTEIDNRSGTMEAKIRDATLQKTPFMIIIGDREIKGAWRVARGSKKILISVRTREGKDLGQTTLNQFLTKIKEKIEKKI